MMTSNLNNNARNRIWADADVLKEARNIPYKQRISWLINNTDKPIPEHKFDVLYEFMFKEPFCANKFGPFNSLIEVIASDDYLYRKVNKDGRALICDRLWEANKLSKTGRQSKNMIHQNTMKSIYREPQWCLTLNEFNDSKYDIAYMIDVYKNNQCLRNYNLTQLCEKLKDECFRSYIVFGRCSIVDYYMCHPTISRIHCILQFGKSMKLYIFDMSVHGTFVNNQLIPTNKYIELVNNDEIRFGDSSRVYKLTIVTTANQQENISKNSNIFIEKPNNNYNNNNNKKDNNNSSNQRQKQLQSQLADLQSQLNQLTVDLNESKQNEMSIKNENHLLKNQIENLRKNSQSESQDLEMRGKSKMKIGKENENRMENENSNVNENKGKKKRRQSKIMFEQESSDDSQTETENENENGNDNENENDIETEAETDSAQSDNSSENEQNNNNNDNDNSRNRAILNRKNMNRARIVKKTKPALSSLQRLPHAQSRIGTNNNAKSNKNENKNKSNNNNNNNDNKPKRQFVIKGINFLDHIDNLSKLTVVKLKLYTDANDIQIGRVKKAQLVKIIQKDLEQNM